MTKKLSICSILIVFVFAFNAFGQQPTIVNNNYAKKKLLGRHFLTLQWLDRDILGRAYVKQSKRIFYLKGTQTNKKNTDYLKIDGVITEVNRYNFKFEGKIITQVSYINDGKPCEREGKMTFAITKRRKYWRLQEMKNSCSDVTDYVDIYFRK